MLSLKILNARPSHPMYYQVCGSGSSGTSGGGGVPGGSLGEGGFIGGGIYSGSTVMACSGHPFTHAMHIIQSSIRSGTALVSLSYLGISTRSYTSTGHTLLQTPAPVHFSRSTVTIGKLYTLYI